MMASLQWDGLIHMSGVMAALSMGTSEPGLMNPSQTILEQILIVTAFQGFSMQMQMATELRKR